MKVFRAPSLLPSLLIVLSAALSGCATLSRMTPELQAVKTHHRPFKVKWVKNIDPEYETGNLPINYSSPFFHRGLIYQGSEQGVMRAYALDDGRVIWQKQDQYPFTGQANIYKNVLIYGSRGGRVYGRNWQTGSKVYAIDLGAAVENQPYIHKGRAFFHLSNHKLVVLDALTGKILWTYRRSVNYDSTLHRVSQPVVYKGKVYVGFADGALAVFTLEEGRLIWEKKLSNASKFVDVDMSPFFHNNKLYIGSMAGQLHILDPSNGNNLARVSYSLARAPILWQEKLYFTTLQGELVEMNAAGQVLRKAKLQDKPLTELRVWKDQLLVGTTSGLLYLVESNQLKVTSQFNLGMPGMGIYGRFVSTAPRAPYIALTSARNRLYLFY